MQRNVKTEWVDEHKSRRPLLAKWRFLLATSTWWVSQARGRNYTHVDASRRDATKLGHDSTARKPKGSMYGYPCTFEDMVMYGYKKQAMHSTEDYKTCRQAEFEVVHPVFVQTVQDTSFRSSTNILVQNRIIS